MNFQLFDHIFIVFFFSLKFLQKDQYSNCIQLNGWINAIFFYDKMLKVYVKLDKDVNHSFHSTRSLQRF